MCILSPRHGMKTVFTVVPVSIYSIYLTVDTTWTILDPLVALWLLDPDHPVSSFEQVLTETGMPQMVRPEFLYQLI